MNQTEMLIAKSISNKPHLAHEHKEARNKLRAAMLVVNLRKENGDVNPSFGLMDEIAHLADRELTLTKV